MPKVSVKKSNVVPASISLLACAWSSMCRCGLRRSLRQPWREIHFRDLTRTFGGRKICVIPFEPRPTGIDVIGKHRDEDVVILYGIVVALTFNRDAVFRTRQLILQTKEVLV